MWDHDIEPGRIWPHLFVRGRLVSWAVTVVYIRQCHAADFTTSNTSAATSFCLAKQHLIIEMDRFRYCVYGPLAIKHIKALVYMVTLHQSQHHLHLLRARYVHPQSSDSSYR